MTLKKKNNKPEAGFATRAIHVGQEPDPLTGAVSVPIYPTSTYVQQGIGEHKGYEYSRVSNPTRTRLEQNLACLEAGVAARVFASGMAAIHAIVTMLKAGDHVVCGNDLYGGTPRLFNQVMAHFGIAFTYVDTSEASNVARSLQANTRMVFLETPTNPLMRLSDIRAISRICQPRAVDVVVDNTFMSPYFQRPLELGADMVVHSTTKFLNGHSDGLGGVVVCARQKHAEKLAFLQKASGAILSPFECWLVLRGVKTLGARMDIHDRNGQIQDRQKGGNIARRDRFTQQSINPIRSSPSAEASRELPASVHAGGGAIRRAQRPQRQSVWCQNRHGEFRRQGCG